IVRLSHDSSMDGQRHRGKIRSQPSGGTSGLNPGRITIIRGCMFSGKTTELLDRLDARRPNSVALFKHVVDRRYGDDAVTTHDGHACHAVSIATAAELMRQMPPDAVVVGLDEAHFFDLNLPRVLTDLSARGVEVFVTTLDLDSWGRPFRVDAELSAAADVSITKYGTCARCGRRADHTQRLTPIVAGRMVGGPESYEPRCRECWRPPPEPPPSGE
ncbi:MAG: thymidine kinase, partial [Phycisphaerae bacterium]